MSALLFLTNSFPYDGGEQFIEEEIKFWKDTDFDKVYLLPNKKTTGIREYPRNIELIEPDLKKPNFYYALKSLINPIFYREIGQIFISGKLSLETSYTAWKSMSVILKKRDELKYCLQKILDEQVFIYSYWNEAAIYAACLLKAEGKVRKVFSRAHGYDLYEDRRASSYMPYKRSFVKHMDKVFLLSQGALEYYAKTYKAKRNQLEVSRLGVKSNSHIKYVMLEEHEVLRLNLLTVSYCVPVKQLDNIMAGVVDFSRKNRNRRVSWVHIGAGELLEKLKLEAEAHNKKENNLFIKFVGHKENFEVHDFLNKEKVDVFINGSSSEGTPVSIMEAMSYGIPTIAPDVGGISDLVNNCNGLLLSSKYSITELSDALTQLSDSALRRKKSKNAKEYVDRNFNSEKNYKAFIKRLQVECDL